MEALTGYHEKVFDLLNELVGHGWGEIYVKASSLKDDRVKVEIRCGKSYIFLVNKDIDFKDMY